MPRNSQVALVASRAAIFSRCISSYGTEPCGNGHLYGLKQSVPQSAVPASWNPAGERSFFVISLSMALMAYNPDPLRIDVVWAYASSRPTLRLVCTKRAEAAQALLNGFIAKTYKSGKELSMSGFAQRYYQMLLLRRSSKETSTSYARPEVRSELSPRHVGEMLISTFASDNSPHHLRRWTLCALQTRFVMTVDI